MILTGITLNLCTNLGRTGACTKLPSAVVTVELALPLFRSMLYLLILFFPLQESFLCGSVQDPGSNRSGYRHARGAPGRWPADRTEITGRFCGKSPFRFHSFIWNGVRKQSCGTGQPRSQSLLCHMQLCGLSLDFLVCQTRKNSNNNSNKILTSLYFDI